MAETKLKTQAMESTTRLMSKIISAPRNLASASGDVAYTGVGFTPTSIICLANLNETFGFSNAFCDSSKTSVIISSSSSSLVRSYESYLVLLYVTNDSNLQLATVKSFDADGFTLTWTKSGSPTGTANVFFLCFR